jgi:hypothetical protein
MRIRMLKTVQGSPNGHTTLSYREGTEHDLTATPRERELAAVFTREGWAEAATTAAAPPEAVPVPALELAMPPVPLEPTPEPPPAPVVEAPRKRKGR